MRKKEELNCPNCGAVITGFKCEYCGTQFFNLADIDLQEAGYLRVRTGDAVTIFKAIPTDMRLELGIAEDNLVYMDNTPVMTIRPANRGTLTLTLKVLPEWDGTFWRKKTKENKKNG